MQKKINNRYSNLAIILNTKGRLYNEPKNNIRTPFQRDRDRIIHSTAFRRLKHKTQVFVNTNDDHYRTRITHSLEVSQIARSLAKYFKINEDLTETLSLAHDLGHTPFGHAGEEILNICMNKHGGFDHNVQTLRIVTLLEKKYFKFDGLNLTLETLEGLVKHNGPVKKTYDLNKIINVKIFKNKLNFKNNPSLEAQIASISDDVAYNSHDLEDGLRANLFNLNDLGDIFILKDIIRKYRKFVKKEKKEIIIRQISRDLINEMVKDIIIKTNQNIKSNKINNIKILNNSKFPLVEFSSKMKRLDYEIKNFLKINMYNNSTVLKKTNEGKKIIEILFKKIANNPKKFIEPVKLRRFGKYRCISDYISGMTDRYAINLFRGIK